MATSLETLKTYFENGKKPTQQEFEEMLEAFLHKDENIQQALGLIAEEIEAIEGVVHDKYMTPYLSKLAIIALTRLADIPALETEVDVKDDAVKTVLRDGIATNINTLNKLHIELITAINIHAALTNNPHSVTKIQVGLGNIPNAKSDEITLNDSNILATSKSIKILNDFLTGLLNAHVALTNNPHNVTKTQAGLGNLPNAKSDAITLDDSNTLATSKAV